MACPVTFDVERPPVFQRAHVFLRVALLVVVGWIGHPLGLLWLGVPVVAIFGSTEPRLTGPLGNSHIILRHHVECSPCFLRECPIDFRCMKAVNTDEVVDAVRSMLSDSRNV